VDAQLRDNECGLSDDRIILLAPLGYVGVVLAVWRQEK
jgi:hypothetical protein